MSYLNSTKNGPVKLSVIIASLLVASCSKIGYNPSQDSVESEQASQTKPMSLVDADNDTIENLDKKDPRFILSEAAKIAFNDKKYREALNYWQQMINQYPDYAPAYLGYSNVARKINLQQQVLVKLYDYKHRFPQNIAIMREIAKVHYELKNYAQALEEVDNAIAIENSDWRLYSLRGVISDKLNYYSEAEASYSKALELSPNNSVVLNNIAVSLMMNNKYDDAESYAVKAMSTPEVNIQAYRTYAKVLTLKGDGDSAKDLLTEKLNDEEKAEDIITSVNAEVSNPAFWGRR